MHIRVFSSRYLGAGDGKMNAKICIALTCYATLSYYTILYSSLFKSLFKFKKMGDLCKYSRKYEKEYKKELKKLLE